MEQRETRRPPERLNIAFIIHNQAETGPYWKVLEQCAAYVRLGHSVTLFCTSKTRRLRGEECMRDGVRVVESPDLLWGKLRQGVDLWNAWRRVLGARRERFDAAHAVDCRPNVIIPALFLQRSQRVPLIWGWWDLFGSDSKRFGDVYAATAGKIEGWLETSLRKYADGAVPITSYLANRLEALGFPSERIAVLHLGCDASIEPPSYAEARARVFPKLGMGEEETTFCFAGTIYDSDFALLARALDIVKERLGERSYRLLWVGKHPIAPETQARYNITHLGVVPTMAEVYDYFAASDACLLPMEVNAANAARWHSKVTDYLNAGAPVALTPVSDFPRHFADCAARGRPIGWVAASGSPDDYAAALLAAAAEAPRRAEKSANARDFARRELDVTVIAQKTIEFYKRLISEHSRS